MYSIYKITSPSGRCYIGLTKSSIAERWRQHVRRGRTEKHNHPFYNAIRKYGPEAFVVEQIDVAQNKEEAQRKEMQHIAAHRAVAYNVSPGGEADGEVGSAIFWSAIRRDPEALAEYIKKLSETKKAADWSNYEHMSAQAQAWRAANPRAAYKQAHRAQRIAARANPPAAEPAPRDLKKYLLWKHKRGVLTQANAFAQWARRTDSERAELAAKIRTSMRAVWAKVEGKDARSEATAAARASIDRTKQGPAASAGLKAFWADLKADPARYAAYMARRAESLKATNAAKK